MRVRLFLFTAMKPTPEVIDSATRGDHDAFAALVWYYRPRLVGYIKIRRMAWAEDIVQEAFLRAWRYRTQYDASIGAYSSWLYRIAINVARDWGRGKKGRRILEPIEVHGELSDAHALPDQSAADNDDIRRVRLALAEISEKHRECVILRDFAGLRYDEIAEITGIPLGSVKSGISRGRREIQDLIGQ